MLTLKTAVPKEHSIFKFEIPLPTTETEESKQPKSLVFELHGSQFENRPVDRANRKFKWKNVDYI